MNHFFIYFFKFSTSLLHGNLSTLIQSLNMKLTVSSFSMTMIELYILHDMEVGMN